MLLFYRTSFNELPVLRERGIPGKVYLDRELPLVQTESDMDIVLVVDPLKLPAEVDWVGVGPVEVEGVPASAIVNLDPYMAPAPVTAAGGYVMREGVHEKEVLMIYRRGTWDIPKGKQDAGETEAECAVREVREEVGIEMLRLGAFLGVTVHGYERKGSYKVKTTYWYEMHTPETEFVPQAEEDIEQVCWVPWSRAVEKIGYETFRRHMIRITPIVNTPV